MQVSILPPASAELSDVVSYYEGEQSGLGYRLWLEADAHIEWIAENSLIPRLRAGDYRRVNLKVFPFYIVYIVRSAGIVIIAIGHSSRKPEYWIKRIK